MDNIRKKALFAGDVEFNHYIQTMDIQTLVDTISLLQKEMASEQSHFDDVSSRLNDVTDVGTQQHEELSVELMAVQANLAKLMARNMKCFSQQAANENRELLDDISEKTSSFNGSGSYQSSKTSNSNGSALKNGEGLRPHIGHKHRKTSPRRGAAQKAPKRRVNYDEGEPDIAGYEESHTSDEQNDDVTSTYESQRLIDFGEVSGESTTDINLTADKNKLNENSGSREEFEENALKDFEKLMLFDENVGVLNRIEIVGEKRDQTKRRQFSLDGVTKGESYTEIDVDRIGDEDEGEEDDPSEWKQVGDDGIDAAIPDGPIIYTTTDKSYQVIAAQNSIDKTPVLKTTKASSISMTLVAASDSISSHADKKTSINGLTSPELIGQSSLSETFPGQSSGSSISETFPSISSESETDMKSPLQTSMGAPPEVTMETVGDPSDNRYLESFSGSQTPPVGSIVSGEEGHVKSPHNQEHDSHTPTKTCTPPASTDNIPPDVTSEKTVSESSATSPSKARSSVLLTLTSPIKQQSLLNKEDNTSNQSSPGVTRVNLRQITTGEAPQSKVHFRSTVSLVADNADDIAQDVDTAEDAKQDYSIEDIAERVESKEKQEMGNLQDVGGRDEGDSVSVKSAVTPACQPSEGFTADDKVKDRTTLKDWDPTPLIKDLYNVELAPDEEEDFFEKISMEGYMEKLPINKKKATLLKTWKRRYFKAENGNLHYFEPPDTVRVKSEDGKDSDKPSGSIQLIGGSIETLDNRIIGIDDGRGRYLVVRAPTEEDHERWCRSLKSQTVENIRATWVKPVIHAIPSRKRKVVIVDVGSCSVRAGILGDEPSLPSLFFPCIMATNPDNGERIFGYDALLPDVRSTHTLSYPVRPSAKVDRFAVDMAAMPDLFEKVFNELKVDPSNHWVMFSAPGNFSDKIKAHFMDILVHRFQVIGVNIVTQTLLSLYSYNSRSGIVVDVGERLEIVPVTDGYIVEAGVTRQPYGGHRVTEALNSSFTESKYRFFTDVEFQIVRLAMEKSCYVAEVYNQEVRKCQENPKNFKKTIPLEKYGLPQGTWKNVTHSQSRFSCPEGLFDTEMWGMDNPKLHKLVAKAVQVCPMDMRREMWRSIFLSGGVTLLPGFAERLQIELSKLAPPSITVQVHASPQRYHSAFIGACALANLKEFEQACIKAEEWREFGPPSLRKWHMY